MKSSYRLPACDTANRPEIAASVPRPLPGVEIFPAPAVAKQDPLWSSPFMCRKLPYNEKGLNGCQKNVNSTQS
jgi:hypothetical protein